MVYYQLAKTIRQYPNKILSHTLGYVGEISPNELKKDSLNYYSSGDFVGISGIEKSYESFLRGNKGYIYKINNRYIAYIKIYKDFNINKKNYFSK